MSDDEGDFEVLPFPFRRVDDDVVVAISEREQEVLLNLIDDMRQLLMADSHDALRRLKPPARPDSEEAEKGYRQMVDDDLLRTRLELLDVVEETMPGATLDDEGVAAWMQSLNNMRLILGERLSLDGVDIEARRLPEVPAAFLYQWIGELLEYLVAAAMPGLPPGDDES